MKKANIRALAAGLAASVAMTCTGGLTVGAAAQKVGEAAQAIMPTRTQAVEAIERANDRWISNNKNNGQGTLGRAFWDNAAYHVGNMEAYYTTGIEVYRNYSSTWAARNSWKGATSTNKASWKYSYGENMDYVLFGDWQICFQTYIDLYNTERMESKGKINDPTKVERAIEVMSYEMSTPQKDYWWWADSLFMVMPLMTKMYVLTGNEQYLDKQYEYFKYAAEECPGGEKNGMWDEEYKLFHRDGKYIYPKHKTDNGKKDFWARGSGWVFAGLARVLSDMPTDYKHRDYFLDKYLKMAEGVKAVQQTEGFWSRSMADRAHADGFESSGTSFFTYGLAWGINSGYLDRNTYLDTCLKGWYFLYNTALQDDGTVGYVQPIGENSKQSLNIGGRNSANFGVGAFLLAASEISKLAGGVEGDKTNNNDIYPYLMRKMVGNYAFEIGAPHFYADGVIQHMDNNNHNQKAYTKDGTAMLPVRVIQEYMGGKVTESGNTVTVTRTITNGNTTTTKTGVFTIGSNVYTDNGVQKTMAVAAEKSDLGYTCIPARNLVETLGYHVWYSAYGGTSRYTNDPLDALIVISEKVDPFFDCDANAVEMLRWMIGPAEHYPTRPAQASKGFSFEPPQTANTKAIGTQIPVTATMVSASATPEAQNNASQVVDNNVKTRWAAQGSQYLTIDLGSAMQIACVGVRMMQYSDGRSINYGVSYSTDGTNYTSAFSGGSIANGGVWEFPRLNGKTTRYIRINVNGSTTGDWASVADVAVFTGDSNSPETTVSGGSSTGGATASVSSNATGTKVTLNASMVKATAEPEAQNGAKNAVDGNAGTVWAAQGSQSLTIDLGSAAVVSSVGVQMKAYDDARTVNYGVDYSADGVNYSSVFSGQCAPGGAVMEYIPVAKNARYVRINVNGNSVSDWASVAEVQVYTGGTATAGGTTNVSQGITSVKSDKATGNKISVNSSMIKATAEPEAQNGAKNAVDGSAGTVWAAQGSASATIDLGSAMGIASVGVQMKQYDDGRAIKYSIEVSADGSSYTPVYSGQSANGGAVMEYHTVGANARYVRVGVNGSTIGDWASVSEIEVYSGAVSGGGATVAVASSISSKPIGVKEKLVGAGAAIVADSKYPAANAADGKASTAWKGKANQSVVIEMNRVRTVTTVGVLTGMDDTFNYAISVSEDGSAWTPVYNGTSVGGVIGYHPCEAKGKYVMITLESEGKIAEVEVYGAE